MLNFFLLPLHVPYRESITWSPVITFMHYFMACPRLFLYHRVNQELMQSDSAILSCMLNIPVSSASAHTSQTTHSVTMATVLVCITMYHRQNTAIVVTMTTYKHPHTLAWAQTWASIVRVQSLTAKSHGTEFQKLWQRTHTERYSHKSTSPHEKVH
jgi:hypothetical protein